MDAGTIAAAVAGFNILVTVGTACFFVGAFKGRLDRVETDVHETRALLVSAAVDASRLTRAEADIHNLDGDIRNLRKGVGFINDENARGVNREY